MDETFGHDEAYFGNGLAWPAMDDEYLNSGGNGGVSSELIQEEDDAVSWFTSNPKLKRTREYECGKGKPMRLLMELHQRQCSDHKKAKTNSDSDDNNNKAKPTKIEPKTKTTNDDNKAKVLSDRCKTDESFWRAKLESSSKSFHGQPKINARRPVGFTIPQ